MIWADRPTYIISGFVSRYNLSEGKFGDEQSNSAQSIKIYMVYLSSIFFRTLKILFLKLKLIDLKKNTIFQGVNKL